MLNVRNRMGIRRVICPNCGETDKDKLPVYKAENVGHVRLEAREFGATVT